MTDLFPVFTYGSLNLTAAPFKVFFGAELGEPETATEAFAMMLLDGEIEVSPRASNRTISIQVGIDGADLEALALAELSLALEAAKEQNRFTLDPGDGVAPVTAFVTYPAQLSLLRDDNEEKAAQRTYQLTFKASPFGLSASPVTSPVLPVVPTTPTVVTIDNGDTIGTAWTATHGTLTDVGANLRVTGPASGPPTVVWTGSPVSLTSTPIISLRVWPTTGKQSGPPSMTVNGDPAHLVGSALESGSTRYYWQTAQTSASTIAVSVPFASGAADAFDLALLQRTDAVPSSGTTRESQRALAIAGSARTQGSFDISHATSTLGTVLLYTCNSGDVNYSPPLRQFRSSGGTVTADTATVSGARETMATAVTFDVPVSQILDGKHQAVIFAKRTSLGAATLSLLAQVVIGGTYTGPFTSMTLNYNFTTTNYQAITLGNLQLPTLNLPDNSTAVVRIVIGAGSDPLVVFDEGWLFNLDEGALSWVEVAKKHVWFDTPTPDHPRPAIYIGNATDRSDAYDATASVVAWGSHQYVPKQVSVFIVTSGAVAATSLLTYTPAWHTYAAS